MQPANPLKRSFLAVFHTPVIHEKSINDLPDDLFFILFGYLRFEDLQAASLVCRKWRQLIIDSTFYLHLAKTIISREYPSIYGKFSAVSDDRMWRGLAKTLRAFELSIRDEKFLLEKPLLKRVKRVENIQRRTILTFGFLTVIFAAATASLPSSPLSVWIARKWEMLKEAAGQVQFTPYRPPYQPDPDLPNFAGFADPDLPNLAAVNGLG